MDRVRANGLAKVWIACFGIFFFDRGEASFILSILMDQFLVRQVWRISPDYGRCWWPHTNIAPIAHTPHASSKHDAERDKIYTRSTMLTWLKRIMFNEIAKF